MTGKNLTRIVLTVSLLTFSFLFLSSCKGRTPVSVPEEPQAPPEPQATFVSVQNPYDGPPLFWVDGYPITEEQLSRFQKVSIASQHIVSPHQDTRTDFDPVQVMSSFIRFYLVVSEGVSLGLEEDSLVGDNMEVFRYSALGEDYMKYLSTSAPIDPGTLKSKTPRLWTQANFQMKVLPADFEVDLLALPLTQEDWGELPWTKLSASDEVPETGLIFPGSGFFDDAVEDYLFTLEEGAIEGPVPTDLGQTFVRVKERKVLTQDEISSHMEKLRDKLTGEYASRIFRQSVIEVRDSIDTEALRRAMAREMETGEKSSEVLFNVGDTRVTYEMFRSVRRVNIGFFSNLDALDNEDLGILPEVRLFAGRIVMGRKAEEEGLTVDPRWEKAAYDFYLRNLYDVTIVQLEERAQHDASREYTEDEMREYFNTRKDRYRIPTRARVSFLKGPSRDQLEKILKSLSEGDYTLESIPGGDLTHTPHSARQMVRRGLVQEGDDFFRDFQPAIFGMAQGEHTIFGGAREFFLVRLDSMTPGEDQPFDKVADRVGEDLFHFTWTNNLNRFFAEKLSQVDVRLNKRLTDEMGIKAPEFMERI